MEQEGKIISQSPPKAYDLPPPIHFGAATWYGRKRVGWAECKGVHCKEHALQGSTEMFLQNSNKCYYHLLRVKYCSDGNHSVTERKGVRKGVVSFFIAGESSRRPLKWVCA